MAPPQSTSPLSHLWIEQSPMAIAVFDERLRCIVASELWCKIHQVPPAEVKGATFGELMPTLPAHWHTALEQALKGNPISHEGELLNIPQSKREWVRWEATPWRDSQGKIAGVMWSSTLLTKQRKQALRRQQQEEHIRMIMDHSVQLMVLLTPEGRIVEVNNTTLAWARLQRESVLGLLFWDVPWWEMSVSNQAKLKGAIAKAANGEWVQREITVYRGEQVTVLNFSITPITDERGEVCYLLPEGQDITERKNAEQAIIQQETNWNTAQKFAQVGIWEWNILTGEVMWSEGVFRIYGLNLEQAPPSLDRQVDLIHEGDRQRFYTTLYNTIYHEEPYDLEFRIIRSDQSLRYIHAQGQPRRTEQGEVSHLFGILLDITDRKQLEFQLQRSQNQLLELEKMSSLGQLLAGVAHEINNPVNFIYGNLSHAENYIQDLLNLVALYQTTYPQPAPAIAEEIEAIDLEFLIEDLPQLFASLQVGADRIKEIVVSLRHFSRMDEAEMKVVDIYEGLESTLMILQNRLKPRSDSVGIAVIKNYTELPKIQGYAGQLNQVFMNILSNAIDALEERDGQPEQKQKPSQITIATEILPTEKAIQIRFMDNGPGIPPSIQRRLFDPFFTTKPLGKGTGLGLAISYQIITEKHHGELICQSQPGTGTEFKVTLPIEQEVNAAFLIPFLQQNP